MNEEDLRLGIFTAAAGIRANLEVSLKECKNLYRLKMVPVGLTALEIGDLSEIKYFNLLYSSKH